MGESEPRLRRLRHLRKHRRLKFHIYIYIYIYIYSLSKVVLRKQDSLFTSLRNNVKHIYKQIPYINERLQVKVQNEPRLCCSRHLRRHRHLCTNTFGSQGPLVIRTCPLVANKLSLIMKMLNLIVMILALIRRVIPLLTNIFRQQHKQRISLLSYEKFTSLAETRLAQNSLNYI